MTAKTVAKKTVAPAAKKVAVNRAPAKKAIAPVKGKHGPKAAPAAPAQRTPAQRESLTQIASILAGKQTAQGAVKAIKAAAAAPAPVQDPRQRAIARALELTSAAPKGGHRVPVKVEQKPAGKAGSPTRKGTPAPTTTRPTVAKKAGVEFIVRTAKPGQPINIITEGARPTQNPHLFAHTHAALTMLGMFEPTRPAVPRKALLTLLGTSAVGHHSRKGNFEDGPDQHIRLSVVGRDAFLKRHPDMGLANAYMTLFMDGDGHAAGVKPEAIWTQVLIPAPTATKAPTRTRAAR